MLDGASGLKADIFKITSDEQDESLVERKRRYFDRVSIGSLLDDQVAFIQSGKWSIEVENASDAFTEFVQENANGSNMSLHQSCISFMKDAFAFGEAFIAVDRASIPLGLSEAEAERVGTLPYIYSIAPDSIRAIEYADQMNEVVDRIIIQKEMTGRSEQGFTIDTMSAYCLWTREEIKTENERGEIVSQYDNPIGSVPIIPINLESSLCKGLYGAVQTSNLLESMSNMGITRSIWGMLVTRTQNGTNSLFTGLDYGLDLGVEEDAKIIHSSTEGVKTASEMSSKIYDDIRFRMRDKMKNMSVSAIAQSGSSKEADSQIQEAWTRMMADKARVLMLQVFATAKEYFGEPSATITIKVPDKFITSRGADIERAKALSEFIAHDKTTWVSIQKRVRGLLVGDSLSTSQISDSDTELELVAEAMFSKEEVSTLDGGDVVMPTSI